MKHNQTNKQSQPPKGSFVFKILQVVRVLSGFFIMLLGWRWLHLFVLTDYRQHHRAVMIPLGFIAVILGWALIAYGKLSTDEAPRK